MRRILTDYRAWMALLALTLILGVAQAGGPASTDDVGYTVEQNGKTFEYRFKDHWRGDFQPSSLKLTNGKQGLEIHYYGSFCVSHRVRKG